jgi:hypothetical protein
MSRGYNILSIIAMLVNSVTSNGRPSHVKCRGRREDFFGGVQTKNDETGVRARNFKDCVLLFSSAQNASQCARCRREACHDDLKPITTQQKQKQREQELESSCWLLLSQRKLQNCMLRTFCFLVYKTRKHGRSIVAPAYARVWLQPSRRKESSWSSRLQSCRDDEHCTEWHETEYE